MVGPTLSREDCVNQNYAPCTCDNLFGYGQSIDCQGISTRVIKNIFIHQANTEKQIQRVDLNVLPLEDIIFVDLFGDKLVNIIRMSCPTRSRKGSNRIHVNPAAFLTTRKQTKQFLIDGCDLSDLIFLTGFDQLTLLRINLNENIAQSFETLPALKSLSELNIFNSPELNDVVHLPKLVNGIRSTRLFYTSQMNDEIVSRILNWLAKSSTNTLEFFGLIGGNVTKIPRELKLFHNLHGVLFEWNQQPVSITSGSVSLPSPFTFIGLEEAEVKKIEPGSFQGNFSNAIIDMTGSKLTRLDSEVFQTLLQQMASPQSHGGRVNLYSNPIDCVSDPCHLAWLIRDDPRLLMPIVQGRCSNGTLLTQLDPRGLNHCPISRNVPNSTVNTAKSNIVPIALINPLQSPACRLFYRSHTCKGVATTEFRDAFDRVINKAGLNTLELVIPGRDTVITTNFINSVGGNKRFFEITLTCRAPYYKLQVETQAFRQSRKDTAAFIIKHCNLAEVDFSFLTGFDQLVVLHFYGTENLHQRFSSLPPLKSLTVLMLEKSSIKVEEMARFPILVNGLKLLRIFDVFNFNDDNMSAILKWVQNSSSNTLRSFTFSDQTSLTRVPKEISSFTQLNSLISEESNLTMIVSGSLVFSSPVQEVFLGDSNIKTIEPNAFQGDFSNANVYLYNNELTRFEESVFKTILQQMTSPSSTGSVVVNGNSFDCDTDPCHLSWLVYLNRELLTAVKGAKCSNGVPFQDLNRMNIYELCQEPWKTPSISGLDPPICSQDYSPCSCRGDNNVYCNRVSMNQAIQVLNRNKTRMAIRLVLSPNDTEIVPEKLFELHDYREFHLVCPSTDYRLNVVKRNNREKFVEKLVISSCDLSHLILSFLSYFEKLDVLIFFQSTNLHSFFYSLPLLKKGLGKLGFMACPGLKKMEHLPKMKGLNTFMLESNPDLDDGAISRILSWLAKSSGESLRILDIVSNRMVNRIPPELSGFQKLDALTFNKNGAAPLLIGLTSRITPARRINLDYSRIRTISPRVFQGNFSWTDKISLKNNRLSEFKASIFRSIMQQMKERKFSTRFTPAIEIDKNPIDCLSDHCHLAWLIRDQRDLLKHVRGGRCSNGTRFDNLIPSAFSDCSRLLY